MVPDGETPAGYLRRITYEGPGQRWPDGVSADILYGKADDFA